MSVSALGCSILSRSASEALLAGATEMVIGPFGFFQSAMKEARPSSAFTVPGPLPEAKAPIGATAMATIASADNFDRERNCRFAANLVKWALNADAAVLTKFGGGVPHTDLSETARLLERMGIKTVVQVTDLARDRRVESALLFNFPEVDAIVCIGGNGTKWQLPRVERVIAANGGMAELLAGPFEIDALNVSGVANQQGASKLRSMIY